MRNALTIDVEEWFHICGLKQGIGVEDWPKFESRVIKNVDKMLVLLKEKNVLATFFVLGAIAQQYPGIVEKISAHGHEIATHGFNHKLLYTLSKEEFKEDLEKSISILKSITGKDVLGHRAPSFSITKKSLWAFEILKQQGIKYDCSVFPILNCRYGMKGAPRFPYKTEQNIIEFPLSTIRIFSVNFPVAGGAYLRILPYSFIKWAIKKINKSGYPAQVYVHSWEIDPQIPRLKMPLDREITHYSNLKAMPYILDMLLKDFEFSPVKGVIGVE